jgi:hypothetical protein
MKLYKHAACFVLIAALSLMAAGNVKYAGVWGPAGSTIAPEGWHNAIYTMTTYWPGAQPLVIWQTGMIDGNKCKLDFPADGVSKSFLSFNSSGVTDKYVDYFEKAKVKVVFHVDAGMEYTNMADIIEVVMNRYKNKTCALGFSVAIEWTGTSQYNYTEGKKVTDDMAKAWDEKIQSINPDLKLVLTHWDPEWFPPTYRGKIIFASENSEEPIPTLASAFNDFTKDFAPDNLCWYIYGAVLDKKDNFANWDALSNPPKQFGDKIVEANSKDMGLFWIAETMKEAKLPTSPIQTAIAPAAQINKTEQFLSGNMINSTAAITCRVVPGKQVKLSIISPAGQRIKTLFDGTAPGAELNNQWNASDAACGVYFCRLEQAGVTETIPLILAK